MPDDKESNCTEERIRGIDSRVDELDALIGKNIQSTIANDVNNPALVSESELQYWADRREERRLLLEEKQRLTNPTTIH